MTALILLFACVLGCVPAPVRAASAAEEGVYAAAVGEVWFYAEEDEAEKRFLIPESYYVRVLERGEPFCTVEYLTDDAPYKKLLGYCKEEALTFVDYVPERPYLYHLLTVTYSLPDAGGLGTDGFADTERTFVYYGDRPEAGQLYLYVLSEDGFGYLPADAPPVFERNEDPSASVSGETDAAAPVGGVQIAVIVLACVAAVAIAVILLRGKRAPREQQEF